MQNEYRLDLQFFAGEGASSGGDGGASGVSSAAAGQSTGETSAAAGQSIETRLEKLGVPKDKIRKGGYKNRPAPAAATVQTGQAQTETAAAGNTGESSEEQGGDAGRKPWDEVKSDYKAEYDAEVQDTIKKRVKSERDRVQRYINRENARAPMDMFFAERYGLDPESDDFYDKMVEKWRDDKELSQSEAIQNGLDDEVQHKLKVAGADEMALRVKSQREAKLQEAFEKGRSAMEHADKLMKQGAELSAKIPGFDLSAELDNPAFVIFTQPGSPVTVEQAYYALHPEYFEQKLQAIARQATEAVSASVRAGAARPAENGSQAASVGRPLYHEMPKEQRENLKRRIIEAGYEGRYVPVGD